MKLIHTADWHLDSAFAALDDAAARRQELREIPSRLADYVNKVQADVVLLVGDLFDSASHYRDTAEALSDALRRMQAQVLIAPGNHDPYGVLWAGIQWPENVHIFQERRMSHVCIDGVTFHGAAFTASTQTEGLLTGFHAPQDGGVHIGLLHGEITKSESVYNPIREEEIAESGLDYLALGHIHKPMEPTRFGKTLAAYSGCIQGRGFDEVGERGFYEITIGENNAIDLHFVPFALRRYERINVNVTGFDPCDAVIAALPEQTEHDIYRILLTGETSAPIVMGALEAELRQRFHALEIQDETRIAMDIWTGAEEDTLRGLFLRRLRQKYRDAATEQERLTVASAARFGLAALERRDLG